MKLLPDSSFFICFLSDLNESVDESTRLHYLNIFLEAFSVEVVPIVYHEINKKSNSKPIDHKIIKIKAIRSIDRNEPILSYLQPLLGKGEYEVISLSFLYYRNKESHFLCVLDDDVARRIVANFITEIKPNLIGTVGLIGFCSSSLALFDKTEAVTLLGKIKESNFRIDPKIIDEIIQKLKL
jgi:predicted nucleic acid-binding protein